MLSPSHGARMRGQTPAMMQGSERPPSWGGQWARVPSLQICAPTAASSCPLVIKVRLPGPRWGDRHAAAKPSRQGGCVPGPGQRGLSSHGA